MARQDRKADKATRVTLDLLDPEVPLDRLEGLELQAGLDGRVSRASVASQDHKDFAAVLLVGSLSFYTLSLGVL